MLDKKKLIEENKKCVFEIFVLGFLPCDDYYCMDDEGNKNENTVVAVHSDEFKSFSELERFTRSVYCQAEADRLLYGEGGKALYCDKDGALCTDVALHGGRGYYVDWDNYAINDLAQGAEACDFEVVTTEENVFNGSVKEIRLPFKAILENGEWKLAKLVY